MSRVDLTGAGTAPVILRFLRPGTSARTRRPCEGCVPGSTVTPWTLRWGGGCSAGLARRRGQKARTGVRPPRGRKARRRAKAAGQRLRRASTRDQHRPRLPQVAVDGKTSRGAKTADRAAPHLLAALSCTGVVLTQCQIACKSNEIAAFVALLTPLDLVDHVVSADAKQTQRKHASWLREEKKAHFVFPVLNNQPTLFDCLDAPDWADVPGTEWSVDDDRGRHELRTIQVLPAPPELNFPYVVQVFLIERTVTVNGETTYQAMLYVTSLTAEQADPADLLAYVRQHGGIEVLHWVRDVTFGEDASRIRTCNTPRVMATLRNMVVSLLRIHDTVNIAAALRYNARKNRWILKTPGASTRLNTEPADFAVPVHRGPCHQTRHRGHRREIHPSAKGLTLGCQRPSPTARHRNGGLRCSVITAPRGCSAGTSRSPGRRCCPPTGTGRRYSHRSRTTPRRCCWC
jgi:predicted transposase YbfD/YdcC